MEVSNSPSAPASGFMMTGCHLDQNCAAVLTAAQLAAFFDLCVDGNIILAEHLAGKPAPDAFLIAAKRLGVEPSRAVVIEDALSGVEACRRPAVGGTLR